MAPTATWRSSMILASYITQDYRRREDMRRWDVRRSIGVDHCLYIRDRVLRCACIRWTLGSLGSRSTCPNRSYQEPPSRTHVSRCFLLRIDALSHPLSSYQHWLTSDLYSFPLNRWRCYKLIDAMLNHGFYGRLHMVFWRLMDAQVNRGSIRSEYFDGMNYWVIDRSIDRLIDWLIDWLSLVKEEEKEKQRRKNKEKVWKIARHSWARMCSVHGKVQHLACQCVSHACGVGWSSDRLFV